MFVSFDRVGWGKAKMRILVSLASTLESRAPAGPWDRCLRGQDAEHRYVVAMTVLDGHEQAVTLSGGEDAHYVVTGLTITGANEGTYCSCSSPTVSHCHFLRNLSVGMEGYPGVAFHGGVPTRR